MLSVFAAFRHTSPSSGPNQKQLQINCRFGVTASELNSAYSTRQFERSLFSVLAVHNKCRLRLAYGYPASPGSSSFKPLAPLNQERQLACCRRNNPKGEGKAMPLLHFRGDSRTMAEPSVLKQGKCFGQAPFNQMHMKPKMPKRPGQGFPNSSAPPF